MRMVVVGDSDFANNRFIQAFYNANLFLNMVGLLTGQEYNVTVRPLYAQWTHVMADQNQGNLPPYRMGQLQGLSQEFEPDVSQLPLPLLGKNPNLALYDFVHWNYLTISHAVKSVCQSLCHFEGLSLHPLQFSFHLRDDEISHLTWRTL